MSVSRVLVLGIAILGAVMAHPNYRDMFPNGYSVPNPCGSGVWEAVGHYDPSHHTHDKNPFGLLLRAQPVRRREWEAVGHYDPLHHTHDKYPFGLDFAAAGRTWTKTLCQKDSDGDGKTNGEELGDPMCTWTMGASPSGSATGQPGICEPIGSGACTAQRFTCGCHGHNCVG